MEKLRKILVMLLALTLLASTFAVMVYADNEQAQDEAEAYDYTTVLEYYEAGYFLNADFNAQNLSINNVFSDCSADEFSSAFNSGFTADANNGTGKFSSLTPRALTITPKTVGSFGFNARASLQKGTLTASSLSLQIFVDEKNYTNLFNITDGKITIVSEEYTTAVTNGTFFTVDFFFDYETFSFTLVVTPDGSDPETYSASISKLNFTQIKSLFSSITYDYLEIYKGAFPRRLTGNDDIVAGHIKKISELYNANPDVEEAIKYLEVVASVYIDYAYTTENVTDADLKSAVDSFSEVALKKIGDIYAENFVAGSASLADIADYNEKLSLVNTLLVYNKLLQKIENDFSEEIVLETSFEQINVARGYLTAASEWLAKTKADTEVAIAAVALVPDIYFATYADLKTFYDLYETSPICTSFYDDVNTAEIVAESYKLAENYKAKYLDLDAKADAFLENTAIAADEEKSFSERYAAYVIAKANIFTDTTYNNYLTDTTVEAVNDTYNVVDTYITPIIEWAEEFIDKVNDAKSTLSYSVKLVTLDEAAEYIETVEQEYPGVTEAIVDYNAVRADIEAKIAATKEYITAVIAVRDAEDLDAKIAAIAVAQEKAVNGNDVSVDVTVDGVSVTNANIILSTAASEVKLDEARSSKFIAAVDAIDNASGMLETRGAILNASSLKANADATLDEVVAASAKLDAAIAAYNASIAAANAEAEESNDIAMATLKRTVPTKPASEIVAIIKKFFED